ncbi:MAG: O-antigen ligase family protein [Steroidobacteraceae bacterium]
MRTLLFLLTVVYTLLLIIRPQEFTPGLEQTPLLQIVLLVAFGVWCTRAGKGLDLPQFALIPLLLVFVWLSLGIGGGWWGGIVPALNTLLPPMLLMVIVSGSVRSLGELRVYSLVLIACACTLVYHGFLQVTYGLGWTGQPMIEGRITYTGIFNDPNDMGLLIVLALALSIYHLKLCTSLLAKLVMLAAVGWLMYGVYLTDSRGTMLATLAVVALELWTAYGKTVVISLGAVAVPVLVATTRLAALDASDESAEGRVDAWYEGMQMLREYPFFGVGWQMFGDHHGLTAHNSVVLAMAELGLAGYTFWLALVFFSGWMIWRIAIPPSPPKLAPALPWLAEKLPTQPPVGDPSATEKAERTAARALLYGAIGFSVGAFFLSQSYKAMLFLNCGLIAGRYLGMREAGIALPEFPLLQNLPRVGVWAVGSVIFMWVLVRVLL